MRADARVNLGAALDAFESRIGFIAARGIDTDAIRFATGFGRGLDYYTGFEFELHAKGGSNGPLVGGGRYDGLMTRLGAATADPGRRLRHLDRDAGARRRAMSTPFIIAVPSKGRLQENAEAFFARAGLALAKPGGARDYRGTIAGLANVEVAYLSAGGDREQSRARRRASRRHRRGPGAREHRGRDRASN